MREGGIVLIYADNAATTKLDDEAFEAMIPWLRDNYGNPSAPYSFSRAERKAITEARETIADCINAEPDEIFFTSGGTESNNWSIKGITQYDNVNGASNIRRTIITSAIEHHAVLNSCNTLERIGYPVFYLPVKQDGVIDSNVLKDYITDNSILVSVMLANNEIGTIQPIKKIAEIAHQHGAYMHTDAVQAVGHIPVNVQDLCVDLLSASAHKFHGPKGVGFLYIRKGTNILPYIDGGAQEKRFRAGTENVAGIVGMAVALKNCVSQMQKEAERLKIITERFYSELDKFGIDYVINGDKNKRLPGNINISIKHSNGEMLLHRLDLKGIYISTGAACDSKETKLSHVIEAIQVPKEYAEGTLRISFGRGNTVDDSVTIAAAISAIVR